MVSEENDQVIFVPDSLGHYVVCFDPLDGSSNIDVNVSIGTIFAIYRMQKEASTLTFDDLKLPGSKLVASGYCMYGSSTVMVMTTLPTNKVNGFTLDPATGEFVLSHPNIRMPAHKDIYSVNQGNSGKWSEDLRQYVANVCNPPTGNSYSLRYVGSMVADVHRTLIYGGIFAYPADSKSKDGKLRLMYEANPMAMIVENAGGRCIYAKGKRVLDIQPTSIHQRTPIFLGGTKNIEELEKYLN
jgi:fructose-1,6-bisphosphatase I